MTTDFAAWLSGVLDEIERTAVAADGGLPAGRWRYEPSGGDGRVRCEAGYVVAGSPDRIDSGDAEHIALHDPESVLADVAAKRRLLGMLTEARRSESMVSPADRRIVHVRSVLTVMDTAVRLIASGYASWPGWREEWAC